MASQKQIEKWYNEALKINNNPKYAIAYAEYRQKAKKADQQLVRLEALAHEKHFEGVLEYAYKGAIRDIKTWGGNKRFNTAPPIKLTELESKIADIDKFLSKPTATKTGVKEIYQNRADTFNKGRINKKGKKVGGFGAEFGVDFTWEDIANYYEDKKGQREKVKLASNTEVRVLATIKKLNTIRTKQEKKSISEDEKFTNNFKRYKELEKKSRSEKEEKEFKQIEEEIEETKDRIKKIVGNDRILDYEVNRLLEQGLDYSKLMGGN